MSVPERQTMSVLNEARQTFIVGQFILCSRQVNSFKHKMVPGRNKIRAVLTIANYVFLECGKLQF